MEEEVDFFSYYKAASSKLKKRFLKKPNVAEASNEFEQLKNYLARIECFPYAGFISIAKARCEQGLLNPSGEVHSLIEAARFFLKADNEVDEMDCPNFHEHLECAISCYNCAIKVYDDNKMPTMAGSVCLEIADYYFNSRRYNQALQHYQRAVQYFLDISTEYAATQKKVLSCQILTRDFHPALITSMKIIEFITKKGAYLYDGITLLGHYHKINKDVEITRLLLILLLNPHPQCNNSEYEKVLHQYTREDDDSWVTGSDALTKLLGEDLSIYMRSLVLAAESKEISTMLMLQNKLRNFFSVQQTELMHSLIKEFQHPTGLA